MEETGGWFDAEPLPAFLPCTALPHTRSQENMMPATVTQTRRKTQVHMFGLHADQDKNIPVAVHVYGPALRWNQEHPDRRLPVVSVHDAIEGFRTMRLVDEVRFHTGDVIPTLSYLPDRPLPAGEGGLVVAYIVADAVTCISRDNWNWVEGAAPIIDIPAGLPKDKLFSNVLQVYLPPKPKKK